MLEQIDLGLRHLKDPTDTSVTVHEVRKCCKKVRAVIKLARYGFGPTYQSENRCFRDTSRHLASARESYVRVETFDSLIPGAESRAIRDLLIQKWQEAIRPALLLHGVFPIVVSRLAEARGRAVLLPTDDLTLQILLRGVAKTFKRGRSAMRTAKTERTSACFHDWRTCVKTLWYHTRLWAGSASDTGFELLDILDRLGATLGEEHDFADLLATLQMTDGSENDALTICIKERQGTLKAQALCLGARIYGMKPSVFLTLLSDFNTG